MQYTRRPSAFRRLLNQLNKTNSPDFGLLLLRLWLGATMTYHGAVTLFGKTDGVSNMKNFIDGAITEVLGWPFPEFMGYLAKGSEFAGGILVAIGLLTRPALVPLATTMAVTAFIYHRGHPFNSIEASAGYLVLCLVILLIGPGKYSLDHLLTGRR